MIRTAGLKLAKSAVIQMRGAGYDAARGSIKAAKSVDFSVNLNKPFFRNSLNTHFSGMVPKKYSRRISADRDLARLL